jgi:hypothetical protein
MQLGLGLSLTNLRGGGFSPALLFAAGEQGAWYDPSDITTLFQDDAGTQPVTAAGQSVGLMLDKSGRGNHATQANLAQRPLYDIDSGGRPFLLFDGSDDGMATGNIVPGTDKAQVFAGVRKLTNGNFPILVELSASATTNAGSLTVLTCGATNNSPGYIFTSGGTVRINAIVSSGYNAPITNVLTGLGDIAAPSTILRVDGAQAASSTSSQGGGNYLTHPLFIGRRDGTSNPFNGRIYGLLVRFGANLSAAQIDQTEAFMAAKTGVTIP